MDRTERRWASPTSTPSGRTRWRTPGSLCPAAPGPTTVRVNRIDPKYRPGVAFGIGLGTESIEQATIVSVDPSTRTITLDRTLDNNHAAGEGAGVEWVRYRWYADALLDNVFWHDHVDGIHGWGHGGVGMLVIEPRNSTYHDPVTGAEVSSGTVVDIRSHPEVDGMAHPLAPGLVDGSFREMVIWTLDDNPVTDSTINLHAAPFSDRGTDPSVRFSSYKWGDPGTPLLRAYPGDPVVISSDSRRTHHRQLPRRRSQLLRGETITKRDQRHDVQSGHRHHPQWCLRALHVDP